MNISTGFTPFFLEAGKDLKIPMSLLRSSSNTSNQAINNMTGDMKVALETARVGIMHAQQKIEQAVGKMRREDIFVEGDEVVLSTRNLHNLDDHLPLQLR